MNILQLRDAMMVSVGWVPPSYVSNKVPESLPVIPQMVRVPREVFKRKTPLIDWAIRELAK